MEAPVTCHGGQIWRLWLALSLEGLVHGDFPHLCSSTEVTRDRFLVHYSLVFIKYKPRLVGKDRVKSLGGGSSFQWKPGPHWGSVVPTGDSAGNEPKDPLKCLLRALSKQVWVQVSLPCS